MFSITISESAIPCIVWYITWKIAGHSLDSAAFCDPESLISVNQLQIG